MELLEVHHQSYLIIPHPLFSNHLRLDFFLGGDTKEHAEWRHLLGLVKIRWKEKIILAYFSTKRKGSIELIYPAVAIKFQGNWTQERVQGVRVPGAILQAMLQSILRGAGPVGY